MHENGQRMQTRQYRTDSSGNEDLVRTADVEYYSFLQAGGFGVTVDENVTIQVRPRGFGRFVWPPFHRAVEAAARETLTVRAPDVPVIPV